MMNKLIIKEVNNGFVLIDNAKEETVIEDQDNEQEAMKKMLETIAEYFGFLYDRWGKENLNIQFNKFGHKVDEKGNL